MALTGYDDDDHSSSDDDGNAKQSEIESKTENCVDQDDTNTAGIELRGLNAANLEEHNKNNAVGSDDIQECNNPSNDTKTEVPSQVGAGLLFGLSGLFLGGPILALLTGVGATYVASNNDGPVGDAARASGEFAINSGVKAGEAAKEVNEKHGILEKMKNAFSSGWDKVRQFDEEHKATEKVKETMSDVTQKTVEFEQKHHVMENILEGIQNGVNFLLDKLRDSTSGGSCNNGTSCS